MLTGRGVCLFACWGRARPVFCLSPSCRWQLSSLRSHSWGFWVSGEELQHTHTHTNWVFKKIYTQMKFKRTQTYNWHSSRPTTFSGRSRCSRARWLWLKLSGWSAFLQKWLWLLLQRWWEGIFCRSGSCPWYGLHVGEHSRTWPCHLPSAPAGRGTSPSCLSAELLQVTEQLSATCACNVWEKSSMRSKKTQQFHSTFFFFFTCFSLQLHQLTKIGFPVTPGTSDSLIIEISHPDWMVDTLQRQVRGPRPHIFTQIP